MLWNSSGKIAPSLIISTALIEVEAIILRVLEANAAVMELCRNLKVIGKHGVGCSTIDLTGAKKRKITVLNTPGANANSVAELIVGLMLDISRNITLAHNKTQSGAFKKIAPAEMTGMELTGKTLGLIGTGNIARRAAEILRNGFGVRVIGYDPYVSREAMAKFGYEKFDTVQELIANSDIVNVSVPLTDSTRNLIAGDTFDCFRKGAVLVNAARGESSTRMISTPPSSPESSEPQLVMPSSMSRLHPQTQDSSSWITSSGLRISVPAQKKLFTAWEWK
ncbi:MAG: hypothetical protein IJS39_04665 [Synergistaceae bacterium]|nr:hypothetical protein [Synergistaceae bacterium]